VKGIESQERAITCIQLYSFADFAMRRREINRWPRNISPEVEEICQAGKSTLRMRAAGNI